MSRKGLWNNSFVSAWDHSLGAAQWLGSLGVRIESGVGTASAVFLFQQNGKL